MASFLGLDFSKNYSWFALPAALCCAHGPHLYAVICAGKAYDNGNPRTFKDRIANESTLDQATRDHFLRAKRASENGYETLGLFAAAVVAGNVAGFNPQALNAATGGYVAVRILFNFVYIYLGGKRKMSVIRSGLWGMSMMISAGLFIATGLKLKDGPVL